MSDATIQLIGLRLAWRKGAAIQWTAGRFKGRGDDALLRSFANGGDAAIPELVPINDPLRFKASLDAPPSPLHNTDTTDMLSWSSPRFALVDATHIDLGAWGRGEGERLVRDTLNEWRRLQIAGHVDPIRTVSLERNVEDLLCGRSGLGRRAVTHRHHRQALCLLRRGGVPLPWIRARLIDLMTRHAGETTAPNTLAQHRERRSRRAKPTTASLGPLFREVS